MVWATKKKMQTILISLLLTMQSHTCTT